MLTQRRVTLSSDNNVGTAAMSLLPVDILRLLPQWWSLSTLSKAMRVCKLWKSIYSLPKRVWVFLELWDSDAEADNVLLTTFIDSSDFTGPKLLQHHRTLTSFWIEDYHCKWVLASLNDIKAQNWSSLQSSDQCYCQLRHSLPHIGFYYPQQMHYKLGSLHRDFDPPALRTEEIDSYFAHSLVSHLSKERDDTRVYLALDKEFKLLFIHYDQIYDHWWVLGEPHHYLYLREDLPVIWEKIIDRRNGFSQGLLILDAVIQAVTRR